MSKGHGILDTIFDQLSPVHPDGHKFVGIAAAVTLLFFFLYPPLGWICAGITAWVIYFFRDPQRVTPLRPGLVVSAADGKISGIEKVVPPAEMGLGTEPRTRISTFLSVFDVHINRAPIAGRVVRSIYVPGTFLNAALDKASEDNERRLIVIETPAEGDVGVVQIAGLVARRIVTFCEVGDTLGTGQRFGLIRFGSRVDVYLPPGKNALVSVGQRAVAGETVLADLQSIEPEREARNA
ncbi:phosphatidylserine decarboxylase [Hyphomicrobium facile]|uniref:Phosphatidylserine decarboxylase proenzyme n=1 Tax=Hyphomicrobium facile TaxID=51670 RepID=A0A1I7NQ19_9HYPH|nr:phosphatidylserine decarboxylase [Hyphomicrobium facile]SFV36670.1 phosphatidylserine decarboxylase [Hyphomicrobium facile]